MLDKAHAGNETAHPSATGYEAGRLAALKLTKHEEWRREIQARNDAAFEAANFGVVATIDRRTPREREKDEQFGDIARNCRNRDDTASPNKPGNRKAHNDETDDDADLKAMGFGSPALMDHGLYDAGAAAARSLTGKGASRGRNPSPMREAARPATFAPPRADADAFAAGEAAARHLLGGTNAMRDEIDNDLRAKFATQQAAREQN